MRKQQPSQPIPPDTDHSQQTNQSDAASLPTVPAEAHQESAEKRQRGSARAGMAVIAGRTAGALSRRLHIGGGTSIIGVVAQRVYPDIVAHLATELEHGSIMVTGTNGKTTTSSFIAAILRDDGLRVWRNREGSNLVGGVASSLVIRAQPNGHLRRSGAAISILEVDEAALPKLVRAIPPRIVVFTNLFRDQLDRYGEVDSVVNKWKIAIAQLPASTTLILNADDPTITQLGENFPGRIIYYGIDDIQLEAAEPAETDTEKRYQVLDTRTCAHCGAEYEYSARFYSHMGHYYCPSCGKRRPTPDIRISRVEMESFDRIRLQIATGEEAAHEIIVPLPGLYNIYNALAAAAVAHAMKIGWDAVTTGIEQSKPVFGRGERIQVEGRTIRLLLAKNPTGFNEVLRTLFSDNSSRHILFILNDNIADGQDISWIWDVDFERAVHHIETLVVSGTRAFDLALRMQYAGVDEQKIMVVPPTPLKALKTLHTTHSRQQKKLHIRRAKKDNVEYNTQENIKLPEYVYGIKNALDGALQKTPVGETLFIVPTYTALLELHRELEQRGFTSRYWEGRDA
ncbi:MurT ligase domain-containing protein [Dictyobacter arantiisoli]|nr:MurT ligase domain-containing protein [Dictyobacter arantiisoli]